MPRKRCKDEVQLHIAGCSYSIVLRTGDYARIVEQAGFPLYYLVGDQPVPVVCEEQLRGFVAELDLKGTYPELFLTPQADVSYWCPSGMDLRTSVSSHSSHGSLKGQSSGIPDLQEPSYAAEMLAGGIVGAVALAVGAVRTTTGLVKTALRSLSKKDISLNVKGSKFELRNIIDLIVRPEQGEVESGQKREQREQKRDHKSGEKRGENTRRSSRSGLIDTTGTIPGETAERTSLWKLTTAFPDPASAQPDWSRSRVQLSYDQDHEPTALQPDGNPWDSTKIQTIPGAYI